MPHDIPKGDQIDYASLKPEIFEIDDLSSYLHNSSLTYNQRFCVHVLESIVDAKRLAQEGYFASYYSNPEYIERYLQLQRITIRGEPIPSEEEIPLLTGAILELIDNSLRKGTSELFIDVRKNYIIIADNILHAANELKSILQHVNSVVTILRRSLEGLPGPMITRDQITQDPLTREARNVNVEGAPYAGGNGISLGVSVSYNTNGQLYYFTDDQVTGFANIDLSELFDSFSEVNLVATNTRHTLEYGRVIAGLCWSRS